MKKLSRKILSVLLVIAMLVLTGAMTVTTSAAETEPCLILSIHQGGNISNLEIILKYQFVNFVLCEYGNVYIPNGAVIKIPIDAFLDFYSVTFDVFLDSLNLVQLSVILEGGEHLSYSWNLGYAIPDDAALEPNIYNLGEETYSFDNYVDSDSAGGHCFGMSVTSSGYYLGLLNPANVGASSSREVYELSDNATVRKPICYYQGLQGSILFSACVAGRKGNMTTDWTETVNYVKNHDYDNQGNLVILYAKTDVGGHAINFLRYEVVDGQERIYAYDNECPTKETYFYQDNNGDVRQTVFESFPGVIDNHIALVYVPKYLSNVKRVTNYQDFAIYAGASIQVENATRYLMYGEKAQGEYYVYEIPEDMTTVKITPLADNTTFTYLGQEYTFGEIDEGTYAVLTLSTTEKDIPEFKIFNEPEDEPTDPEVSDTPENTIKDCFHLCHNDNAFVQFIWKIINFLYCIFGANQYCDCGKAHW